MYYESFKEEKVGYVFKYINLIFITLHATTANRHISSTDYNLHSSRSHTLFQMVIESRERSSTSTSIASHRRTLTTTGYGSHAARSKETVKISQLVNINILYEHININ